MYKEYKFPLNDKKAELKAALKQYELRRTYGCTIPVYKIQNNNGQEWLSIVHPVGLQPKQRKRI